MKSFRLFSTLSLVPIFVLACSSGSRLNIPGRQCPANYNPIDLEAGKTQGKTWTKGDNESAIPAGTYVYQRSDLIFKEKGDKGTMLHVEDSPDRSGVFHVKTNCLRNGLDLSQKNLSGAMNTVSKMIATVGQAVDVEAKEVSFKVVDRRLVVEAKPVAKPASLEKVYEGKSTQLYMLPMFNNDIDYEVRAVYEDNLGTYIMSVKFKRTP